MRVLYFTPHSCWPLTTGARLRDYYLARELAARGPVTFVGLCHPGAGEPAEPPADAGFRCHITLTRNRSYTPLKLVRGLLGPTPIPVLNYSSRRVARQLTAILEEGLFDTVQLESVHLLEYVAVIRAARARPAILADWHNIESEVMWKYSEVAPSVARRLAARRTAQLLEQAEQRLLAACDAHTVASERDRRSLMARLPGADLHVVPNGVDVGFYTDDELERACKRSGRGKGTGREIVFVGSMDYHANIDAVTWFAKEIWPGLRRKHPNLRFTIAGRSPAPEVRALASDSVTVTGTVEDVRPFYAGPLALVAPLRVGGGTRLKILEAMAAGVPVVSTRLGAEGLEIEDGRNILLADTAGQFLTCIDRLISSSELRRGLSQAGHELVRKCYDWPIAGAQLYRIHRNLLERRG
jgi:glycosyltransferase involved in cell wall biosynthesis